MKNSNGVIEFYKKLAISLKNYEHRKEQAQLTHTIANAIESKQHLVAEAPTGTGKSFAVIGACISTLKAGKTVLISTANNNLLRQYAEKDLPFLSRLFPSFTWAEIKGKANYLCLYRLEQAQANTKLFKKKEAEQLHQWGWETTSGDVGDIPFNVDPDNWKQVMVDDNCHKKECSYFEKCHYFKAKQKAADSSLILTNHSLALKHVFNPQYRLLPDNISVMVFDEAHELEGYTLKELESSVSYMGLARIADMAMGEGFKGSPEQLKKARDVFFDILINKYNPSGDADKSCRVPVYDITAMEDLLGVSAQLQACLKAIAKQVCETAKNMEPGRKKTQMEQLKMKAYTIAKTLKSLQELDEGQVVIYKDKSGGQLKISPIRVSGYLHKALFERPESLTVIQLSATLSVHSRQRKTYTVQPDGTFKEQALPVFKEHRQRVGLAQCLEFICPSPFDYNKQMGFYLPIPEKVEAHDPNKDEWRTWAKWQCLKLTEISQGRALVLCSSARMVKVFGDYLKKHSLLPVRCQGDGTANNQLVKWLATTPNAILVGTASFWSGISIEGSQVSLVIIDKVPFQPKDDPYQAALQEWYELKISKKEKTKSDYFNDLLIYPSVVKLKQGIGRLIRTKTDTGIVAILDPRLAGTKGMYQKIYKAVRCGRTIVDPASEESLELLKIAGVPTA